MLARKGQDEECLKLFVGTSSMQQTTVKSGNNTYCTIRKMNKLHLKNISECMKKTEISSSYDVENYYRNRKYSAL